MVRLLVSLKLRLLQRGMQRAGSRSIAGFVLAWALSIGGGVMGAAWALALGAIQSDRAAADLTVITTAVVVSMWAVGPLVTGSESTLDPERLALLPLDPRRLMPGLLAAGAVGFGGVATVIMLAGLAVGMAPSSANAVLTVAGAVLLLALCVATSRLVTTALSAAMRTRRMRDVSLFVGPLAGITFSIGFQVLPRFLANADDRFGSVDIPSAVRIGASLFPSGLPTLAITSAREGDVVTAVAALTGAIVLLALILDLWSRVLARVLTTAIESGYATGKRRSELLGGVLSVLPSNRFGVVVAKELRLSWRDPRQRSTLIASLVPAVVPLVTLGAFSRGAHGPSVLLAAVPAFVIGASSTNLYGFDGAAHWTNVAAGARGSVRSDLAAKGAARVIILTPFVVLAAIVLATFGGTWDRVPLALGLACAAAGVTVGLGLVGSVRSPMPLPDTPSNPFSTGNAGQGMAAAGSGCITLAVGGALVAPVAIAATTAQGHPLASTVVVACGVGLGALAWTLGLRSAVRRGERREPELLAQLDVVK